MSAGYATPYYPAKSFNGANNWQLGFYSDRQVTINPAQGGKVVTLATFVDYGKSNKNDPVLVKVGNAVYLQYNRAKDFNYQAQQNIDQVTVVQQLSNGTNLLGGVDVSNPQLTIANFDGTGQKVVIYACQSGMGSTSNPDWMKISIGYNKNFCLEGATAPKSVSTTTAKKPAAAPVRTYFRSPTKAPARAPSKPSNSQCKDVATSFTVKGRGTKTCAWLSVRPSWQPKLCPLEQVRASCPKTCKVCK
jgi:hypothetical protein